MTYHLFNAKRMPIGRIAVVCSQVIRGKNKPGYDPKGYKNPDKCVIVNMGDPYMTGRKRQQKVYRHHTGYPGGLKEFTFKDLLEKDPNRILNDAIQGMMPKNSLRHDPMKHITIFHGPYHDLDHLTLPQFRDETVSDDINDHLGFNGISAENSQIIFSADGSIPDEYKDLPQELDGSIAEPLGLREKTHRVPRENYSLARALKQPDPKLRRYKRHRA